MPKSEDIDVLKELASLPTIAHPTVSPEGDTVALYYDGTGRNELHLLDIETGELTQVSDGEVPRNARWYIKWSANSEQVFYHLDEDGNEQNDIHTIDREGNARSVIEMDGQVTLSDVGDDGETLIVGSTRDGQMNLYYHNLSSAETTKLTNYDEATGSARLSPDCDHLAFSTNETDDKSNTDVYVATLTNIDEMQNTDGSNFLNARNLEIGEIGAEASPSDWGPEGKRLLVQDNTEDLERAGIYNLDNDEIQWYGNDEFSESPMSFLPNGDRFLATRTREAVTVPIIYDVESGESRELELPDGVSSFGWAGESVVSENQVLIQHTTPTRRTELLLYDLNADEYEVLKEAEYGPFDPDEDFADATYFRFPSDGVPETTAHAVDHDSYDELEIGGLLYDCGEHPSPLIVNPHGGPPVRDTKSFDLYTQTLIQRGYSVLKVNYRGSSGRGREFLRRLYDDWGGAEQGDVATGLEYVLENHDWIDEDRIVVFGGSYGGYSAYWQMVQYPELYDAGIAWIGVSDLPDMYENTMPHFKTELMEKYLGKPEENPDLYEERSPSTHANNVAAPLLIVHGVNDRRVPISQARIFRDELEQAGYSEGEDGEFEYHELGEEGHASSDQRKKLRMFRILDDFLQRRVPSESEKSSQK